MFDRVNRSGQPLKASEVFDALHGSFEGRHPSSLRGLIGRLAQATRFGILDDEMALGALHAIHRGEPLRRLDDILTSLPSNEREALITMPSPPALDPADVERWAREDAARALDAWTTLRSTLPLSNEGKARLDTHLAQVPLAR